MASSTPPLPTFCPYCAGPLKFIGAVPRCTKCRAVFHLLFSRFASITWIERRDADYLVNAAGKILGRVITSMVGTYCAEAVYAAGGDHRQRLGDYIDSGSARRATEAHVKSTLGDPKDAA